MSNNLNAVQLTASQTGKEAAINTMFGKCDAAITERLDVTAVSPTTLYEPTLAQWRACQQVRMVPTGAYPASSDTLELKVFSGLKKIFNVFNDTVGKLTVSSADHAETYLLDPGASSVFFHDDAGFVQLGKSEGTQPYDVGAYYAGTPGDAVTILSHIAARAFTIKAGMPGSQWDCGSNPAAATTLDVQKNGTNVGSISVTTAGVGTFAMASDTSFAAGDILSVVTPNPADASMANITLTIAGER